MKSSGEISNEPCIDLAKKVLNELWRAESMFPAFNSAHEGYAVIKEELDELWEEIRKKPCERDLVRMGQEAIQVAAMGMRFYLNVVAKVEKAS